MAEITVFVLYNFTKEVVRLNRIKQLRQKYKMTQSELAHILKCSNTAISNYEVGLRDLDSETVCKLCDVFLCTADYLLGRSSLPTAELSEEESRLLQAYRRGDDRAKDMVKLALEPFVQEAGSSETA